MKAFKWTVLSLTLLGLAVLPSVAMAGSITVQVGYADNLRPSGFFPTGFCSAGGFGGSSGATCAQTFDSGAIKVVNNTGGTMTVTAVSVQINTSVFYGSLWTTGGNFTIADGTDEVLAQTGFGNFDSSDNGNANFPGDGFLPIVSLTFTDPNVNGGASTTASFTDSGQILNTGGFDTVNGISGVCIGGNNPAAGNVPGACNESLQWRDIGTTGFTNPGGGTPEPASLLLLLTGAGGIIGFARRRYFA